MAYIFYIAHKSIEYFMEFALDMTFHGFCIIVGYKIERTLLLFNMPHKASTCMG